MQPSTVIPLTPTPADSVFGPAPVGSVWFAFESAGGVLEKGDVTIGAGDVPVCPRNGVTLAIAAWPSDGRATLPGAVWPAEEDDLHALPVDVDLRGTRVRSFQDAVVASGTRRQRARSSFTSSSQDAGAMPS